jgi:hypothetical protein
VTAIALLLPEPLQATIRALRVVKEGTSDTGTAGCTDIQERGKKLTELKDVQSKFKQLFSDEPIMSLNRRAFIAHCRFSLGYSKKRSKKLWETKTSDPDVSTNGLTGKRKELMVRGIRCIRGQEGLKISKDSTKDQSHGSEDDIARRFRRPLDVNYTDTMFETLGGEAMKEGAAVPAICAGYSDDEESTESNSESKQRAVRKPASLPT